ncbi:hypothetical protein BY996DRAFT_7487159 [Phakopsora pachyrhizi]|nr:hypothetical protein BY996DRAFT_7487159 [Phakopsora pachyrhizi]
MEAMFLLLNFLCLLVDPCWSTICHSLESALREELQGLSHNVDAPGDLLTSSSHPHKKNIFTSLNSALFIEQEPLCEKAYYSVGKEYTDDKRPACDYSFKHGRPTENVKSNYCNKFIRSNSDNAQILNERNRWFSSSSKFPPKNHDFFLNNLDPISQGFTHHIDKDSNRELKNQLQKQTSTVPILSTEAFIEETCIKSLQSDLTSNNKQAPIGFPGEGNLDKQENTYKEIFDLEKNNKSFIDDFDKQLSQSEYFDCLNLEQQNDGNSYFAEGSKKKNFIFSPQEINPSNTYYRLSSRSDKDWSYIPDYPESYSKFDETESDSLWINELLTSKTITELHESFLQLEPINSPVEKSDSAPHFFKTSYEKLPYSIDFQQPKEPKRYKLADGLMSNGSQKQSASSVKKNKKRIGDDSVKKIKKKKCIESVDIISKASVELLLTTLENLIRRENLFLTNEYFDGIFNKFKNGFTKNNSIEKLFAPYYQIIQSHMKSNNQKAFNINIENTAEFFSKKNFKGIEFEPIKKSTDKIFEQIVQMFKNIKDSEKNYYIFESSDFSNTSLNHILFQIKEGHGINIQSQGKKTKAKNTEIKSKQQQLILTRNIYLLFTAILNKIFQKNQDGINDKFHKSQEDALEIFNQIFFRVEFNKNKYESMFLSKSIADRLPNESDHLFYQIVNRISKYYYHHYYNTNYLKSTILGVANYWIRQRCPKLFQSITSLPMQRLFWNFIRDVVFFIMKSS